MKTVSAFLAIILAIAQQAKARTGGETSKDDQSTQTLVSSLKLLLRSGALQKTEKGQYVLHPDFIEELKKTETIEEVTARSSTICTGPY